MNIRKGERKTESTSHDKLIKIIAWKAIVEYDVKPICVKT
jgi:hypothetical protein